VVIFQLQSPHTYLLSCGASITSANHALRCSNHRQADRQADRHTRQADRQADRHTRQADRHTRQADRHTRQADRQADRHTRQADRHTRQVDRHARQARIKEFVSFVRSLFPLLADHISIYWM
jgi:uncharacterized membrane protein YqiK